jgi:hypothetical protein
MVIILRHCEGAQRLRQSPITKAEITTPPLAATNAIYDIEAVSLGESGDCFLARQRRSLVAMTDPDVIPEGMAPAPWKYSQ